MIFQYTWPQVVTERKTATRRVLVDSEQAIRGQHNRIIAVAQNGRTKWQIGATYAVQPGRGQRQIARISIKRITRQKLSRITNAEARAEGFANRQEFIRTWEAIHGKFNEDVRVWVIEFELAETRPELQHLILADDQTTSYRKPDYAYQGLSHSWKSLS